MSQHAYYPTTGGSVRDNEPRVSNLLGHSYGTIDMGRNPLYNMENSYDRNRSVASLTQKAQFDWNASPIQSAPSPPGFGHASAAMFGYPPPSPPPPPPATTVYPSAVYESAHPERDTRRSLPGLSARQYHHEGLTYPSMRDYRYQPTVGMGSFSSI
ncbi:hypothetical protein SAMD00023353_5800330 [Rosellinia necatrix]|uniref:Uncharacterized protein n=1 Tax=Rosellinia necatrix TaxID=77044 RepID=A0A1W2TRY5_ROSNE|nr:hypothetical protein SAMD00023353_5800330 [Rosellinia necatrix]